MGWLLLAGAIICEVLATLSMKASDGLSKLWPTVGVGVGYLLAFILLSQTLKTLPLGIAYATWAGLGTAGAAVGAVLIFGETLNLQAVIGIVVIIGGVAILNLAGVGH